MEVNKKNILWADDEIESLKPHIMFLEDKGYNVIAVNSGEDAIDVCSNKKIDVLLIDEMMTRCSSCIIICKGRPSNSMSATRVRFPCSGTPIMTKWLLLIM